MKDNPFTLMFGSSPILSIERPEEKNQIIESFQSEYMNNKVYLITAIRGSGKTVLMVDIADYFKIQKDWIVVQLDPLTDMKTSLLAKLNSLAGSYLKSLNLNLSFFNILTIGTNLENKITDVDTAIIKILEHLKNKNIKVLITVDEVVKNENMKLFASMFQIISGNHLPVFLLMTGLYENIKNLQDDKSLTFLYRSLKINLSALNINAISIKYKQVFALSDTDSLKMAKLTNGYAFAFQVLGYLTFRHNGNYKEAMDDYRLYLEEYSYKKIWSELSSKDKEILYALARSKNNKINEVMEICNMDNNHFNPYRKRLLNKGVVVTKERGKLSFVLPLFKEYILDNYFEE